MLRRAQAALSLVFLMLLTGCGVVPNPFAPPDLTGNWQIQSGSGPVTGSNLPNGVLLLGALQSTGSKVTGTFRFTNLTKPGCDVGDVISVSGGVDAKNMLTLTSSKLASGGVVRIQLLTIPALGSTAPGTIQVTGGSCPYASAGAVGVEVASVTGSFAGTLVPGTIANPGTTGGVAVTLALTQAATPNPDGQFALSGNLVLTVGSCMVSRQLNGTISGVGFVITNVVPGQGIPTTASMVAFADPSGASLKVAQLLLVPAPCAALSAPPMPFTGSLTKQ